MKTEKEIYEQLARLSASETIYNDIVAKIDNGYSLETIKSHSLIMLKGIEMQHKILSEETRKDFENENCEVNIPSESCVFQLNNDCRGCVHYKE